MMGVEERLAHVEGLVAGHAQLLGDLRTAVTSLENRIDRRFDQVETRFTQIDARFTQIEGRLTGLGQTFDAKIDGLQREMSTHFRWTMGALVTIVAVFLGAVLTR